MKELEREHRRRSIHREVNERIAELIKRFSRNDAGDPSMMVVCECGIDDCMASIEMRLSEYEAVRAGTGRWVVSSAHIGIPADSILATRNGYALIQHPSERLPTEALAPRKESTSLQTADSAGY